MYLNASPGSLLRVHDDGLHVLAEDFSDGHVVTLVSRLTHIDHSIVLEYKINIYIFRSYFFCILDR